jgi:hypothetical protein
MGETKIKRQFAKRYLFLTIKKVGGLKLKKLIKRGNKKGESIKLTPFYNL